MERGARARRSAGGAALARLLLLAASSCAGGRVRATEGEAVRAPPFELVYSGTADVEGDFEKPGERRTRKARLRALSNGADRLLLEESTWIEDGDAPPRVETTLVRGGRVWRRVADGGSDAAFV